MKLGRGAQGKPAASSLQSFALAWLCRLSPLDEDNEDRDQLAIAHKVREEHPSNEDPLLNRFHRWGWNKRRSWYPWQLDAGIPPIPTTWQYNGALWIKTHECFRSLRWRTDPNLKFSLYELGFLYWIGRMPLPPKWYGKRPVILHSSFVGSASFARKLLRRELHFGRTRRPFSHSGR